MGLNPATLTDLRAFLDLHERPDEAVIAYVATVKVYRLDHCHSSTELNIDNARCADVRFLFRVRIQGQKGTLAILLELVRDFPDST